MKKWLYVVMLVLLPTMVLAADLTPPLTASGAEVDSLKAAVAKAGGKCELGLGTVTVEVPGDNGVTVCLTGTYAVFPTQSVCLTKCTIEDKDGTAREPTAAELEKVRAWFEKHKKPPEKKTK